MKTDRKLLELAAKAIGLKVWWGNGWQSDHLFREIASHSSGLITGVEWNPRANSADALELAASLRIDVEHGSPLDNSRYVLASRRGIEMARDAVSVVEEFEDERARADAMCLAITRAAAAIGEVMP